MIVPNPKTWADHDKIDYRTARDELFKVIEFKSNPPMCFVYLSASFTVPNTTITNVAWQTTLIDTEGMWDAADATKIKPKTPGIYKILFGAVFSNAGVSSLRDYIIDRNGSQVLGGRRFNQRTTLLGGGHVARSGMKAYDSFNGTTDYIVLRLGQDSGVTLDVGTPAGVLGDGNGETWLYVRWEAPLP